MTCDLDLHIAKLDLQPGDILVVKSGRQLSREAADRIRDLIARTAPPGIRTLLLEPDWDLAVIREPIL